PSMRKPQPGWLRELAKVSPVQSPLTADLAVAPGAGVHSVAFGGGDPQRLLGHQPPPLLVDQRQQLVSSMRVALMEDREDVCNLAHVAEDNRCRQDGQGPSETGAGEGPAGR